MDFSATPKLPIDPLWFNYLIHCHRDEYQWLADHGLYAQRIANFGCWNGEEPFALLWVFDASEIAVVEIDPDHAANIPRLIEKVYLGTPQALQGRSVKTIIADMSMPISDLQPGYFDLAFCKNVLYNLKVPNSDFSKVQSAIYQMVRSIRVGGYIVAIEPKMGVEYSAANLDSMFSFAEPLNDPYDVSDLFASTGLLKSDLSFPFHYVYQKQR